MKLRSFLSTTPAGHILLDTGFEPDDRRVPRVQFAAVDIGAVEISEPLITQQPMPQDLPEGQTFMLSVAAMNQNSSTPLKFQWRKDGMPISAATTDTFSKSDAKVTDSGSYDVLVINDGGSLPSATALVTVTALVTGDAGSPSGGDSATGGNSASGGSSASGGAVSAGGSGSANSGGCGCRVSGGSGSRTNALALGLLLTAFFWRSRRSRQRGT